MSRYEVSTDLIIHTKIKVVIEADSREEAIDNVAGIMPANYNLERSKLWAANVTVKPPKGIEVTSIKAYHFEQASGFDKARKLP
jgi:hypothetical protein